MPAMSKKSTNSYQATFILDTRNYDQPVETLIEKFKTVIESIEGTVKDVKNMGQHQFTYVVDKKFPMGIYVRVKFDAPGTAPATLQEKFRLDRTVNRILVESI